MEARRTPLLIGAGAAVVAVVAAVILVRGSSSAVGAPPDAGEHMLTTAPSAQASNASSEPVASVSASAEPATVASATASARTAASTAPHAVGGARSGSGPETVAAAEGADAGNVPAEAGASRPRVVRIDESNDGKTIELAPGQELVATLDANPTTGFDWAVIKAPTALGSPEMGYVSGGSAPGSPGKRHLTWTLKSALPAGDSTVELGYARSFEKGVAPFKTYRFKVRGPSASAQR